VLILSDVDGTFLDDCGELPFEAAELAAILNNHTVVFCSSRTAGELLALQERLGWPGWAVAEDGAVLVAPDGSQELLGAARGHLEEALRGAGSGSALDAMQRLAPEQPDRIASVLLPRAVVDGPHWAEFRAAALSADLRCSPGGRWATLTRGADKGQAALTLSRRLGLEIDVGIGNDANDAGLLAVAARRFVIRNPDGHHPLLAALPGVTLLNAPGPLGWKEMVRALQAER
jgi:mannosyl-3-phosphoglycerate phosphatase